MRCKKCEVEQPDSEFYPNDKTCKCCRRELVKANREAKADYYRQYDRDRANQPDRVQARREYKKTESGKEAHFRAIKTYREKHPMRHAAHVIVRGAMKRGDLVKPHAYESCGSTGALEAHHDDYTKPLDVRWLCDLCHKEWHRNNEPIYQ
jgi:hypothetical protein